MQNTLMCLDANPTFLNLFDFSVAPTLLFYSYIPILVILIFISFFILIKDKFSLQSKALLTVGLSFSIWIVNIIFQWIGVSANLVFFSWEITAIIEIIIPISTIYLVYVLLNNGKDLSFKIKLLLSSIILPIIILLPTRFNMEEFTISECAGIIGPLLYFVYFIEIASAAWLMILGLVKLYKAKHNKIPEEILKIRSSMYLVIGSAVFLTTFSISNILGELTQVYAINLFGPIGMVVFLGLLSFMIVKFKTFNVKLLAAEALVWGLTILIGSQFFFIRNPVNRVLNGITFVSSIIFGYFLIRSVKKEVKQKEELAELNLELQDSIKQRESLVHLITHKVKGSFTRTKFIFAGILDGTFGETSPEIKKVAEQGLEFDNGGIETVDLVLNVANMQKGLIKYEMKNIDFKEIVLKSVNDKKLAIEAKGLALETEIKEDTYNISGDAIWLKEAINNLIENSTKYTKTGKITVALYREKEKILLSIKDTGMGITEEDKVNLFTEGGRGKESIKVNTDSTGYGLYTVKLVIEAHKGRVWGESEGTGKGSQFFVELPTV